jgi:single-strand DNA-binding protein
LKPYGEPLNKEEAQYHRIVAWQKLAELCGKLLTKGKKVYVEGRITYRDYTTKEGQKKTVAEIVLDDFIVFNDTKKAEGPVISAENPHEDIDTSIPPERSKHVEDVNLDDIPF